MVRIARIDGSAAVVEYGPNLTPEQIEANGSNPESIATLRQALVTCQPSQMPPGLWYQYLAFIVHLRDVPGQTRPAAKPSHTPDATHNLMVAALDPKERYARDDLHAPGKINRGMLHPLNYSFFVECSDDQAVQLFEALMNGFAAGTVPLESDLAGGRRNVERVLKRTLEHIQTGGHMLGNEPAAEPEG